MQVNTTLTESQVSELKSLFGGSNNANARTAIEILLAAIKATAAEYQHTKKPFSKKELSLLIDLQNGLLITDMVWVSKSMLIAEIEDAEKYDKLGDKWQVDTQKLIKKISAMHPWEIAYWRILINQFWNDPNRSLDKFVNQNASNE